MSCKEKYGLTPKQILSINEGRCCNKARYLLEMRKDAWEEEKVLICGDESFSFCKKNSFLKPIPLKLSKFKPQFIIQSYTQIKENKK